MKAVFFIAAVSVFVCVLAVVPDQAAANPTDVKDALLNYKWSWCDHCDASAHTTRMPNGDLVYPNDSSGMAFFKPNGVVRVHHDGKILPGDWHWSITGPNTVRIKFNTPGNELTMTFDPTFSTYAGTSINHAKFPHSNMHGEREDLIAAADASPSNPALSGQLNSLAGNGGGTLTVAAAAQKPSAPAATLAAPPPAAPPGPSRLDEVIDRRSVLMEDIFSPLEREVPASIRDLLADLRENLLDEAARHPAAIPQAYDLGARYCNGLIAAYDERMQMVARLHNNAPTNAALDSDRRKVNPRWIDYLRERDEAARATYNNTIETPLAKMLKVQWAQQAQQSRQKLDAFYGQFRAAARQPVTAKAH